MIKSILSLAAAFVVVALMGSCGKCKKNCKAPKDKKYAHSDKRSGQ